VSKEDCFGTELDMDGFDVIDHVFYPNRKTDNAYMDFLIQNAVKVKSKDKL